MARDDLGWKLYFEQMRDRQIETQKSIEQLRGDVGNVKTEIVKLKGKSSFWGALSGSLVMLGAMGFEYMKKKLGL